MEEPVIVDYDEKLDILKIVVENPKDSTGVDFPGGVIFRSVDDGSVTGIMILNASKIVGRKNAREAQLKVGGSGKGGQEDIVAAQVTAVIYTDGSCIGNPGPGGWAAIVEAEGKEKEFTGGEEITTNNRMELLAVINGLSSLEISSEVTIFSDSQYVINGIEKGWAKNWKKNGWKKSNKEPALNSDLWDRLLDLCEVHNVRFKWVRGHAGNPKNERCDKLAQKEAKRFF